MFWVHISPLPHPPTLFHFLNIVQYLFVHCTKPSILGSYPPYPTSSPIPNIAFTSTLTPPPPTRPPPPHLTQPPPPPIFFFFEFSQKLKFFVHIHPDPPNPTPPPDPPPAPPLKIFFFEFSQKLQFFIHIHPDPPPPPQKKKILF